jgi:hypothetical protein
LGQLSIKNKNGFKKNQSNKYLPKVVIFIEWHLKIDGFTVGALPVYWFNPVYYN